MMEGTRHTPPDRRRATSSAARLATPLAAILLLAITATASASAQPSLAAYGLDKHRGFTLTPPFQRGKSYRIMCDYGCYLHQNGASTKDYYALDFDMPAGEPVHPAAPGKVVIANSSYNSPPTTGFDPYGKFVLIEHLPSNFAGQVHRYYTMYAHLDTINVSVGAWVDVDAPLGTAGKTGSGASGINHLHFVLYEGVTGISTSPASYSVAQAVVPEPFAGCTKAMGGDCENLDNPPVALVLHRDDFAPAVIARPNGVLDLFTCNRSQRNLMTRRRDGAGVWGNWINLGGVCASSPTAVRDGANNVFVFVRGLDGWLWFRARTANGWEPWAQLTDSVVGRPAAALDTASGFMRVFVRKAPSQQLFVASQQAVGSTAFTTGKFLGGTLMSSPVAGARADGRIDVYLTGDTHMLWKIPGNGNGTFTAGNFQAQNVPIEGEPSLVAQGALEWVARSVYDQLVYMGLPVYAATHRPAVARNDNGLLYMFERDRANSSAHYVDPFYVQSGSFGGVVASEIAAIRATSSRVMMFAWGRNDLYYIEQTAPNTLSWSGWTNLQIPQ